MLKKLKMDSEPVSFPNSFPAASDNKPPETRSKRATVEDDEDDTDGRQFAPGGDADYFAEEDEEGRFFGGGLTSEQKEILNIFEQAEGNEAEDEASYSYLFDNSEMFSNSNTRCSS
jgi:beta-catenin-like protein 1